jgi:hypothetical protein
MLNEISHLKHWSLKSIHYSSCPKFH